MTRERTLADPASPAPFDYDDIINIQALATGTASAKQQIAALEWIVTVAARFYQPSYLFGPDGDRQTVFNEGKRFVGQQIVTLTKINAELYKEKK